MISADERLRLKPCVPVEQNWQLRPQPTCEETQSVPRLVSGMKTVSIAFEPSMPSSHLYVASLAWVSNKVFGGTISAAFLRFSRSALPGSGIDAKVVTLRW